MNHETPLGVACHMMIIIGLSALVVAIIISQRDDFKEEYKQWKNDRNK